MRTLMKVSTLSVVILALTVSGCSNMTNQQQRALSAGAIGAAGGTAIAAMAGGGLLTGALIGGAGGAALGALLPDNGNHKKSTEK